MEENHYYPFGLKHSMYTTGPKQKYELVENMENIARPTYVLKTDYQYKYNGKELQDELGLNMYDMDMRQYDPAIARWVVLDPVIHHSMSPYNAFDNNPVFWADPSGANSEKKRTTSELIEGIWNATPEGGTFTWQNTQSDSDDPPPGTSEIYWKDQTGEYFLRQQGDSYAHFIDAVYVGEFDIVPFLLEEAAIQKKKPKTYKLTDSDFWSVEPTSNAQTAGESLVTKITGVSGGKSWVNLISKYNPGKSPLTLTPASIEVFNDANTIRGAKERLITLGAGNTVIIDTYPSVTEGSANRSFPTGHMRIIYEGRQDDGKYIFSETIVNTPYSNLIL